MTARTPRAGAEAAPRVALAGVSARARRRAQQVRGGPRRLTPTYTGETAHSFAPHADEGSFRNVWRELLLRLMSRGAVRLSEARTEDDPQSEPASDDE